jgi:hypothetical protein
MLISAMYVGPNKGLIGSERPIRCYCSEQARVAPKACAWVYCSQSQRRALAGLSRGKVR